MRNTLFVIARTTGAALVAALCMAAVASAQQGRNTERAQGAPTASADVQRYFDTMAQLLAFAYAPFTPGGNFDPPANVPARQFIQASADFYAGKLSEALAVSVPPQVRAEHDALVRAFAFERDTFARAAQRTPDDAPATLYTRYLYSDAASGYAFVAETNAKCGLQAAARRLGATAFAAIDFVRVCNPRPEKGSAIGRAGDTVNKVTLVHERAFNNAADREQLSLYPNLYFSITEIWASARRPFELTLDNRNPRPFLFNLAIYAGNPESLLGLTPIAVTDAGGIQQNTLKLHLPPGVYTFVDNVHPYSARGVIYVH